MQKHQKRKKKVIIKKHHNAILRSKANLHVQNIGHLFFKRDVRSQKILTAF